MTFIAAIAILIVSAAGIGVFLYKKLPFLANYFPREHEKAPAGPNFFQRLKHRIKNNGAVKKIVPNEMLLLRLLSKSRIYLLKIEHKVSCRLTSLRKKTRENKKCFSDDYWMQLKEKTKKAGKKRHSAKLDVSATPTLISFSEPSGEAEEKEGFTSSKIE